MLGERFRRQLLMDGHYAGNLAFVATCTDDLTLSELRKNLKVGDEVPQHEAAMMRNTRTKQRILADTLSGVRRIQSQGDSARSSNEELRARGIFPAVFTTSARDYQKLRGLLDTKVDGAARVWSRVEARCACVCLCVCESSAVGNCASAQQAPCVFGRTRRSRR